LPVEWFVVRFLREGGKHTVTLLKTGVIFMLVISSNAWAASASASIAGNVLDDSGNPMQGVVVSPAGAAIDAGSAWEGREQRRPVFGHGPIRFQREL